MSCKQFLLWENPIDHKWKVVDIPGFVFGDSTDPKKAVEMAVALGIPKDDIETGGVL